MYYVLYVHACGTQIEAPGTCIRLREGKGHGPPHAIFFAVWGCSWLAHGTFWLENAVQEPPAGYTAEDCWFLGTGGEGTERMACTMRGSGYGDADQAMGKRISPWGRRSGPSDGGQVIGTRIRPWGRGSGHGSELAHWSTQKYRRGGLRVPAFHTPAIKACGLLHGATPPHRSLPHTDRPPQRSHLHSPASTYLTIEPPSLLAKGPGQDCCMCIPGRARVERRCGAVGL